MAIAAWQAGTLYQPNDLVVPASTAPALPSPPTNPGFEDGDTGWTKGSGFTIVNGATGPTPFSGTWKAVCSFTGESEIVNDNEVPVVPGQSITASCQCAQSASADYNNRGRVAIKWFTSGAVFISRSDGNVVEETNSGTPWRASSVTAVAPATAAFAVICGVSTRVSGGGTTSFDEFTWDYVTPATSEAVVYRATQADAGFSGSTEPTWPGLGFTVVDNEVTWEGVIASRVTWEAQPILVSGATMPTFPTSAGGTVLDGTIIWVADTGFLSQAPESKVVTIGASKIFAGDEDIIPYSATVNPKDWTTAQDAGYLPYGIQTYGSNPVAALALYRGNLVALNSEGFQMWQIDEDPASMSFLDALPIGSTYQTAIQPVGNDLMILSQQGIRNFGIAAASTNLAAGSFGEPIDPLVIASLAGGAPTASCFYPARGQYWLAFGATCYVLSIVGKKANWSRYVFPEAIVDFTLASEDLYMRTAEHKVWKLDDTLLLDDVADEGSVALLLHFDTVGTDLPTDSAVPPNTITNLGGEQQTGVAKFTASWQTNVGNTPLRITAPTFNLGNETQFSIDCWMRKVDSAASFQVFGCEDSLGVVNDMTLGTLPDGSGGWILAYQAQNSLGDTMVLTGYPVLFPEDQWVHVAVCQDGDTTRLFQDGVLVDSEALVGGVQTSFPVRIAQAVDGASYYVDELRVVTGAATYTGNFTPPVAPYGDPGPSGVEFEGVVQWPFLDLGNLGVQKTLEALDVVATGTFDIQVAYNQKNIADITAAYTVDGDTLTGEPIPLPLSAPSFSLKLTFAGNQAWEWNAANLYVGDNRGGGAKG